MILIVQHNVEVDYHVCLPCLSNYLKTTMAVHQYQAQFLGFEAFKDLATTLILNKYMLFLLKNKKNVYKNVYSFHQ